MTTGITSRPAPIALAETFPAANSQPLLRQLESPLGKEITALSVIKQFTLTLILTLAIPAWQISSISAAEPMCAGGTNPDPNVIWCDDFEDSTPLNQKYFEYDSDEGDFARVPGKGLLGSFALQVKWQKGEVDAGNIKRTFGRSPVNSQSHPTVNFTEIYWRQYLKMELSWTGSPDKLSRATVFASSNWAQAMIAHLWSSGDFLVIDPASGIDTNGNLLTTKYNDFGNLHWLGLKQGMTPIFSAGSSGQWYCIEAHVKLNTPGLPDGVFEFWINNNLEASKKDLNWVGTWQNYGINAVFFENYWNNGAPAERIRYFDNIIISTRRIGCMEDDKTPPSSPIGLTVR